MILGHLIVLILAVARFEMQVVKQIRGQMHQTVLICD